MRRSYRVSNDFDIKLKYLQEKSKNDGIAKTQEQILDEMMSLYLLYVAEDKDIFITEEIQKQMININELFLTKQAQMQNVLLEQVQKQHEEILNLLSKVAK